MPILFKDNQKPRLPLEIDGVSRSNPVADAIVELSSVMYFPSDPSMQMAFVDAARAWSLVRLGDIVGDGINFSSREMVYVHGQPSFKAFIGEHQKCFQYGTIASEILLTVIQMSKHNDLAKFASAGTSIRAIAQARRAERGFSVDNIKRYIWAEYRPVAHLWAAAHMCRGHISDDEMCTEVGLGTLLALSEAIRLEGESWRPLRAEAGETILDPNETWRPAAGMLTQDDVARARSELTWHRPSADMLRDAKITN